MPADFQPIQIAEQGSFFIGGRTIEGPGVFNPIAPAQDESGLTFRVDHAFVRYQVPANAKHLPVVMVHGQGQFSKTWETTSDGREGFATTFLRAGHPVYLIDFPRRGGAGIPTFKGAAGAFLGEQFAPNKTMRFGNEEVFIYFRLGPRMGKFFDGVQFSKDGLDQFFCQNIAHFADDFGAVTDCLCQLFEKIGDGILLTHSQSGHMGWRTGMRSPHVKAIISYEPGPINGFYFLEKEMPAPMKLFNGSEVSFAAKADEDGYAQLLNIPICVIYGDFIGKEPIGNWYLDLWRVREIFAREFCSAITRHGGNAKFISLPEVGIHGNTHFPMSDLNSSEVEQLTFKMLRGYGL